MTSQARWFLNPLFGDNYRDELLGTESANLIAYWPLTETSGTTADNAERTAARDGTYSGITLNNSTFKNGDPSGLWDGANDHCDVYSTSLNTAFDRDEGTMMVWAKVSSSAIWTDSTARMFMIIRTDGDNYVRFRRSTTNNLFSFDYKADGTAETVNKTSYSSTDWFHVACTWSKAADEFKAYIDGVQEGSTLTIAGTWTGDLTSNVCVIGAATTTPAVVWLAHAALWTTPLAVAQILHLTKV